MTKFLKFIFYILVLFLIGISLFPGSILGYLFYGDLSQQPVLIESSFGSSINHFIYYFCTSILGFFIYSAKENFQKIVYGLFFLSITLEGIHYIVPNRSFQLTDLIGNILGVLVAYFLVKICLYYGKV